MTAPTPEQIAEAINDVKRIRGTVGSDSSEDYYLAENILIKAAAAFAACPTQRNDELRHTLAELTTKRAELALARQHLAEAWDEGVAFGWHSTELRTDENPYRKARS